MPYFRIKSIAFLSLLVLVLYFSFHLKKILLTLVCVRYFEPNFIHLKSSAVFSIQVNDFFASRIYFRNHWPTSDPYQATDYLNRRQIYGDIGIKKNPWLKFTKLKFKQVFTINTFCPHLFSLNYFLMFIFKYLGVGCNWCAPQGVYISVSFESVGGKLKFSA